jgi:hypothetical protein
VAAPPTDPTNWKQLAQDALLNIRSHVLYEKVKNFLVLGQNGTMDWKQTYFGRRRLIESGIR